MIHVPINAITWSLGFVAFYTLTLKSRSSYRRTRNPLAQMYYWIGLSFGTGLFFFGVPGLFTQNLQVLSYSYFMADFFTQVTMQIGFWLMWFLGLRNRIRLRLLLAFTIPFSVVLMVLQGLTLRVELSQSPYLIEYLDQPPVLILKSIIYGAVSWPLGFFILRQAPSQLTLSAKIKSAALGLAFILVSTAAIINNVFERGGDTKESATIVAIFFVVFFLAQLLRPSSSGTRR
jgi:hypothetical protein